jgi:glycosyltransferase involved in cell wall biosynthesis
MNVLFICSGKSWGGGVSPIVSAQAASLSLQGINVDIYTIANKGVVGYCKEITPLVHFLGRGNHDVIHAHYSLSGIIACIANYCSNLVYRKKPPLIVSLMGSDVKQSNVLNIFIKLFVRLLWSQTIVKSSEMYDSLGVEGVHVIPNGVSLSDFKEMDKPKSRKSIGLEPGYQRIVLLAAERSRGVKNYELAENAMSRLNIKGVKIICLGRVAHNMVPYYLNACDVVLLTSKWEGSPNVVKEAMACNCPIVSTDVGDVRWLLDGVSGCYVAAHEALDVANKIELALNFNGRTNGREKLISLQLDSESVAKRIIEVYNDALLRNRKPLGRG